MKEEQKAISVQAYHVPGAGYLHGLVDCLLGRAYSDGATPPFRFEVFVPRSGRDFASGYRNGWLAGRAIEVR